MKIKRKDIELMIPVGSFESLMAAIQSGADSVYFGIEKMNMRARSSQNFSREDMKEIVRICKKESKKIYLALNIVYYNNELKTVYELIDIAKESGVSAVIVTDHAAIAYANEIGIETHVSTQVNISNIESVKFYSKYADVIVMARELNLEQVTEINKQIKELMITGPSGNLIRTEMFIHGALCMSISGKCYLSLHEQNYSANRGECMQTCRKVYTVREKESGMELDIENEYIMSPKDLCTIHFLNKIIDSGVKVLKVEGRARPPEYVKVVTECYNEGIHSIANGSYNKEKIEDWRERLSAVFNRGFWDGYYLGQKLGEWSEKYGSNATKRKVYIAKGMNYFPNIKVAEFLCEAGDIAVGDEIYITGPTTGVIHTKIKEIRVDLKNVEQAKPGERFSIPVDTMIRRSDRLYKIIKG